jgi:hypothetical protein
MKKLLLIDDSSARRKGGAERQWSLNPSPCTGRFIMFSEITNIYNKKTKGPALMELFTTTGQVKKYF